MVKVGDVYGGSGGRFLNAELVSEQDLWGVVLTIAKWEKRTIKDRDKIVLSFKEIEDLLVLNATNAQILAEAWGDETDDWVDKQLSLRKVKRNYQGKLVNAIEVEPLGIEADLTRAAKKSKKSK